METLLLSCPHCGFSREVPRERIPQTARSFTCPSCQRKSSLASAVSAPDEIVNNHSSQSWQYWEELDARRRREEEQRELAASQQGVAELLRAGWRAYRGRWGRFSAVYLTMLALGALPWLVYWQIQTGGLPMSIRWQGSLLVLLLTAGLSLLGVTLGSCALLQLVVNERSGFYGALRDGLKNFPGYLVLSGWMVFMVVGGGVLLIPGLIFAGLFAFAAFVFLHEKECGRNALCISAQYVRTSLWSNLGKIALLFSLLAIGTVFFVVQIVVLPYVLSCLYLLYVAARQQAAGQRTLAGPRFNRYFVLPVMVTSVLALVGLGVVTVRKERFAGFDAARLRQMVGSVVIDSWRMSNVASPGCGLVLERSQVGPGEQFKVRLVPAGEIPQNYYLCVTGEGVGESESYLLDQEVQKQRYLVITAPRKKGEYQVSIYSDYDRTVAISSMNFQVN